MWWRILTFCVLVTLILFVVLSCIHGRPVVHLFFHRCCEDNIENDQVIFENFGNSFIKERLIGVDIEVNNSSLFSEENVDELIASFRKKNNVHDPRSRDHLDYDEATDREMIGDIEVNVLKTDEIGSNVDENTTEYVTPGNVEEEFVQNTMLNNGTEKNLLNMYST
ncbi:uncharacterized protein ACR2FA_008783 [Aphomia sociella]